VLLFDADKAVGTIAADHAIIKATQGFIRYADRIATFSREIARVPSGETSTTEKDSSAVIRVPPNGRVDTFAKVRDRPTVRPSVRNEKAK
jgi:hypothetical protein